MIYPTWRERYLIPSRKAQEEMDNEGLDLRKVAELLNEAKPSGTKRSSGVFEMIVARGERSFKITVVESFQYSTGEVIHLITHVKSVKR